jgi:hypothetical protein
LHTRLGQDNTKKLELVLVLALASSVLMLCYLLLVHYYYGIIGSGIIGGHPSQPSQPSLDQPAQPSPLSPSQPHAKIFCETVDTNTKNSKRFGGPATPHPHLK